MSLNDNILLLSRKASEITVLLYERMCTNNLEDKSKISSDIENAKKEFYLLKNNLD